MPSLLQRFWPRRLAARLTLLVSFTAGLSTCITVAAMMWIGWRAAESQALSYAREDARSSAFALAAPLAFEDEAGTGEVLDLLLRRADVLAVWVRSADGRLQQSRGRAADLQVVRDGGGLRQGQLVITEPVLAGQGGDRVGTVTMRFDLGATRSALQRQVIAAGIAAMAVLLLTLLLARQVARRMSVPVVRLAEAASALTRDWSRREHLTIRGPGEIGVALKAFNHMVDELGKRDAAVHALTGDLRDAAAAAETARALAESASLSKTRFLANMSHELRSPLNGVIGAAQLLKQSDGDPAFRAELVRIIEASGNNLLDLIEGVLDVSRIEAGGVQTETQPFNLVECIEAALAPAAANTAVKGLGLEAHVDTDVPGMVTGDRARLKQLLQNLLGNAVKFSDAGQVSLTVTRGDAQRVCFCVADTGIGIPADQLESIFEPFQQGDASTTRRFGGSGLGLTICREIARLMGGDVQVESTPGVGSRFTLSLPLPAALPPASPPATAGLRVHCFEPDAPRRRSLAAWLQRLGCESQFHDDPDGLAAAARGGARVDAWLVAGDVSCASAALQAAVSSGPAARIAVLGRLPPRRDADVFVLSRPVTASALQAFLAAPQAPSAAGPTPARPDLRSRPPVLLVEDDPVNRLVIRSIVQGGGFDCEVAEGGAAALERLRARRFEVVLMDWQMPDMDGLEVTRHLRAGACGELNIDVAVIALTANAFAEDRAACMEAGMNDFLTKPVQEQALLDCVRHWHRGAREPMSR